MLSGQILSVVAALTASVSAAALQHNVERQTVTAPGPTDPLTIANCNKWYVATANQTAENLPLSLNDIFYFNPELAVSGNILHDRNEDLIVGNAYCIGVDSNLPPGIVDPGTAKDCDKWVSIGQGSWWNCGFLMSIDSIPSAEFYKWNPLAQSKGCVFGNAYCAGVASVVSLSSSSTTSQSSTHTTTVSSISTKIVITTRHRRRPSTTTTAAVLKASSIKPSTTTKPTTKAPIPTTSKPATTAKPTTTAKPSTTLKPTTTKTITSIKPTGTGLNKCGKAFYTPGQYVCWQGPRGGTVLCPIVKNVAFQWCDPHCYDPALYTCDNGFLISNQ